MLMMFQFLCLCLAISITSGLRFHYDDVPLKSMTLKYRTGFLTAASQTSMNINEDFMSSSIKFDLIFTLDKAKNSVSDKNIKDLGVEVLIFPLNSFEEASGDVVNSDSAFGLVLSETSVCCSAVSPKDGCEAVNDLSCPLIQDDLSLLFPLEAGDENEGKLSVRGTGTYPIRSPGKYAIIISFCSEKNLELSMSGVVTWKGALGLLPGDAEGYLGFYKLMSVLYSVVAVVWAVLCCKNLNSLIRLQSWISAVLVLGMLEVYLRFADYESINTSGERKRTILFFSIMFLALKKSISRMLILFVAMGYGIVRPSLGNEKKKVFYLGSAFFFISFLDTLLMSSVHSAEEKSQLFSVMLFQIPLVVIDIYLFNWVFKALRTTLLSLEKRGQSLKQELFTRFRSFLLGTILLTLAFSLFSTIIKIQGYSSVLGWQNIYALDAFWDVLYFTLLVIVMAIFKPSVHAIQYAYASVELEEGYGSDGSFEFDENEFNEEIGSGDLAHGSK